MCVPSSNITVYVFLGRLDRFSNNGSHKVLVGHVGHNNPTLIPSHKSFVVLDQQCVGGVLEPVFRTESRSLGCQNTKYWFQISHQLQTSLGGKGT